MGRTHRALPTVLLERPHFQRLRNIWYGIKHRTSNPNHCHFKSYGARGIVLCERWVSVENFYADMVGDYAPGLEMDRIDNNKGYSPENCRWANKKVQANNRRSSRLITINGETRTLEQWIAYQNLKSSTVRQRIYGLNWPIDVALEINKEEACA